MGQLRPVTQTMRVTPSQDVLHIRHLSPEDAGRWVCRVANQFGEQRLETQLTVTAQLSVHVQPQLQVSLLTEMCRPFQKELYNFESLCKFIHRICTVS
jgi:hypothetical protein